MITVYLDSQDYSVLSNKNAVGWNDVRVELKKLSGVSPVYFCFSDAIVGEAAPTGEDGVEHAIHRADLVSDLCRNNALKSFTEMLKAEAIHLMTNGQTPVNILAIDGRWFSELKLDPEDDISPAYDMYVRLQADATIPPDLKSSVTKLWFISERKFTKLGRENFEKIDREAMLKMVTERFPMKHEYAEVIIKYVMGEAPQELFLQALTLSMIDARWVMRWCAEAQKIGYFLGKVIRGPSESMNRGAHIFIAKALETANSLDGEHDGSDARTKLKAFKHHWDAAVESLLQNVVSDICKKIDPEWTADFSTSDIAHFCPGINTLIRSVFSSYWDNIGAGKRQLPTDSQFADAMHAIYAPYVTFFRADSYMAPHIKKFLPPGRDGLVAKLRELPEAIRTKLGESSAK